MNYIECYSLMKRAADWRTQEWLCNPNMPKNEHVQALMNGLTRGGLFSGKVKPEMLYSGIMPTNKPSYGAFDTLSTRSNRKPTWLERLFSRG